MNRLFAAEKKRAEALHALQQQQQSYDNLLNELTRRRSQGMDVGEMIRYEERIILEKKELELLQTALADQEKKVLRERDNVIQKSKERKVMEKLKVKQDAAWKRHLNKKEAALLDEIAVIFHER